MKKKIYTLQPLRKFTFIYAFLYCVSTSLFGKSNYTLCIDGGGSKTTLQVLDQNGQLLSLVKNGCKTEAIQVSGSNINVVGKEGVKASLQSLFEGVQIDQDSINLVTILPECRVIAGIAGISLPQNKQTVIALFEEYGIRNDHIVVMSDAELALQLIDDEGIVLIAGTGSICFGKKNLTLFRVGGLGRILGDEGSGYQIGLQALKAALADEYGWGISTNLTEKLKDFFSVSELKNLIPQINSGEMPPAKIAGCTSIVFQQASEKDQVANQIITQAANDLGNLLITQLRIANLSHSEIHLWGGIFKDPHVDTFIQEIVSVVNLNEEKILKIINKSNENAAVLYAAKFFQN